MSDTELDLNAQRARLEEELEALRAASSSDEDARKPVELDQASVGRLSRMDAMQMQAMAQEKERRRQRRMRQIEAAIARLDEDDYGYCIGCGEDIAAKRLLSDPAATHCIQCSSGQSG
jgi:DnaK suppressor protein